MSIKCSLLAFAMTFMWRPFIIIYNWVLCAMLYVYIYIYIYIYMYIYIYIYIYLWSPVTSVISVLGPKCPSTSVLGQFDPRSVRPSVCSILGQFGPRSFRSSMENKQYLDKIFSSNLWVGTAVLFQLWFFSYYYSYSYLF